MALLWWRNNNEDIMRWVMELRLQSRYYRRMRDHYLNNAVLAHKKGDKALAAIYEEEAIANEKSRILTMKNLHRIERALEQRKLAKGIRKTARIVEKAQERLNREKVRKTIVKAVTILTEVEAEDQLVPEAMDMALQEAQMDPHEVRKIIHTELKARLKEEVKPELEAERLREEIRKEVEKEGA